MAKLKPLEQLDEQGYTYEIKIGINIIKIGNDTQIILQATEITY
jgi:hypothetical protein